MISSEEIEEIRIHLESSQNPLFFFDNDADGLCAFLIFQRALGRGRGIPIKSYPDLSEQYLRRVSELNPDSIFILDKAEVSPAFVDGIEQRNLPIIWIDHHKSLTPEETIKKVSYYNSYPESEPTTFIAQKVFNRKNDLWLAMIGCIADVYTPDFDVEFEKQFPELYRSGISAFNALHSTEIGKYSQMLNFGLMNSTTNVIKLLKYLTRAKGPYDLLEESFFTRDFHKRYNELNEELEKLLQKARESKEINPKLLYFTYSSSTSMSAILASKLYFEFPNLLIVVGYKKPDKINLSIRGHGSLELTNKIVEEIEGSTGGGHPEATGAMIPASLTDKFEELLKNY